MSPQPQHWRVPNGGYEQSQTANCFSGRRIYRPCQYQRMTLREDLKHSPVNMWQYTQVSLSLYAGGPIVLMQLRPSRECNPTLRNWHLVIVPTPTPTIGQAFKSLVGNSTTGHPDNLLIQSAYAESGTATTHRGRYPLSQLAAARSGGDHCPVTIGQL